MTRHADDGAFQLSCKLATGQTMVVYVSAPPANISVDEVEAVWSEISERLLTLALHLETVIKPEVRNGDSGGLS